MGTRSRRSSDGASSPLRRAGRGRAGAARPRRRPLLTGPTVDREQVRAYLEKSLALAESFGAKVIVFGSPAARTVPDGFPREQAWAQLVDFLRLAGQVIETRGYGMVIGIEALRTPETTIVN